MLGAFVWEAIGQLTNLTTVDIAHFLVYDEVDPAGAKAMYRHVSAAHQDIGVHNSWSPWPATP